MIKDSSSDYQKVKEINQNLAKHSDEMIYSVLHTA